MGFGESPKARPQSQLIPAQHSQSVRPNSECFTYMLYLISTTHFEVDTERLSDLLKGTQLVGAEPTFKPK